MKTTSIEARKSYLKSENDKKDYQRIINALILANEPLTFKEIARQVFLKQNSEKIFFTHLEVIDLLLKRNYASNVSRRLSEMVRKEMIIEDIKRPCKVTGLNCYTYKINYQDAF
jgi:hypothetical protein